MDSNPLFIRLYGDFVFEKNLNHPLSFKSRKTEAVLLALALNREAGASRDMLCGLLWPDLTQDRARAGLRQALSRIRSLDPDIMIEPKRGWLCLSEKTVQCDFWTLTDDLKIKKNPNIAIPQGEFLNHYPRSTDLFSDWVETQKRYIISDLQKLAFTAISDSSLSKSKRESACEFALQMEPTEEKVVTHILEFCKSEKNEALYRSTHALYCRKLETDLNLKPSLSFTQKFPKQLPTIDVSLEHAENKTPVLAIIEKFQVRGNNPDHAYLGEALPDDIITHLARQNWFDVQIKDLSWPEKPANVTIAETGHDEHLSLIHI